MDAVAAYYDRNSLSEIIKTTCHDVFVPITAGGGVRTVQDAADLLAAGADKIAVNTAALEINPLVINLQINETTTTVSATDQCINEPKLSNTLVRAFTKVHEFTHRERIVWSQSMEPRTPLPRVSRMRVSFHSFLVCFGTAAARFSSSGRPVHG